MSDVSITDLIARLRYQYTPSNPLANVDIALVMGMAADALESVTAPIESAELLAIQSRADAAAEGPWRWEGDGPGLCTVARGPRYSDGSQGPAETIVRGPWTNDGSDCVEVSAVDAEFIAHARTDIPYLLGEIAKLSATAAAVPTEADPFSQSPHMASKYWGELVKARKRIAELEAAAPTEPVWELQCSVGFGRWSGCDYEGCQLPQRRRLIAGDWEYLPAKEPTQ